VCGDAFALYECEHTEAEEGEGRENEHKEPTIVVHSVCVCALCWLRDTHIYTDTHTCTHREREREKETCTHTYTYTHIYMDTHYILVQIFICGLCFCVSEVNVYEV